MNTKVKALFPTNKKQTLLRLLQLSSPALPVGTYAYSQGLEQVVEARWVDNAESLEYWLKGVLRGTIYSVDLPIMQRFYAAWATCDLNVLQHWNDVLIAYRETAEIRREELDKGHALLQLLTGLEISTVNLLHQLSSPAFLSGYCAATAAWQITLHDAAEAYVWAWLENQVVSAIKIMPLGQQMGQKLLHKLIPEISVVVADALQLNDEDIGPMFPAQTIACAQHETQYTRLFRS